MTPRPPSSTLFPYTTLFRSSDRTCGRGRRCTCGCCTRGRAASSRLLRAGGLERGERRGGDLRDDHGLVAGRHEPTTVMSRSEEHTSELQSRFDLVCRLLLEK